MRVWVLYWLEGGGGSRLGRILHGLADAALVLQRECALATKFSALRIGETGMKGLQLQGLRLGHHWNCQYCLLDLRMMTRLLPKGIDRSRELTLAEHLDS